MIAFAERAKEYSDSPKGKAMADNWKATALVHQGHYEEALRLFEETLKQEKEMGERAGMAATLSQIGAIYFAHKMYHRSAQFALASFIILQQISGGDLKQVEENFNIAASKLPQEMAKKIV